MKLVIAVIFLYLAYVETMVGGREDGGQRSRPKSQFYSPTLTTSLNVEKRLFSAIVYCHGVAQG